MGSNGPGHTPREAAKSAISFVLALRDSYQHFTGVLYDQYWARG